MTITLQMVVREEDKKTSREATETLHSLAGLAGLLHRSGVGVGSEVAGEVERCLLTAAEQFGAAITCVLWPFLQLVSSLEAISLCNSLI